MPYRHSALRFQLLRAITIVLVMLWPLGSGAVTVGYWRMDLDIDSNPGQLEVQNEIVGSIPGATNLFSTEAFIDTGAYFGNLIPVSGDPNLGSIGSISQGGNDGINATIPWYAELDVSSITLEYWARTPENTATLFSRSSGNNGITIDNPRTVDISYWVEDGFGGAIERRLDDVYSMPGTWHHYAFIYDEFTGIGEFWVDGFRRASRDDEDNRALYWGSSGDIEIGRQLDFAAANNGTFDELRIDDRRLPPIDLLITPEPGSASLLGLGLIVLSRLRARRTFGSRLG